MVVSAVRSCADGPCRRPVVSRTAAVPDSTKLCRYFVKTGMVSPSLRASQRIQPPSLTFSLFPRLLLSIRFRSIPLRPSLLVSLRLTSHRRMRESVDMFLHPRLDENVPLSTIPPQEMSTRFIDLSSLPLALRQQFSSMQALSRLYRFAVSLRPHYRRKRCRPLQGFRRDGLV